VAGAGYWEIVVGRPQIWCLPGQTTSGRGEKEIVVARYRDYHTLPERLALYAEALCALWNIQLSSAGVPCSRPRGTWTIA
jgi:hypothetical protein